MLTSKGVLYFPIREKEFILAQNHPIPAVRAVIEDRAGKVLLLSRDNTGSFEEKWCLPGGKINLGQTAEEVVIREVREEIDLLCKGLDFLFNQDNPLMQQLPDHFITFYFRYRVQGRIKLNRKLSDFA